MPNNKKPSLYKKDHNAQKSSLYRKTNKNSANKQNNTIPNVDFSKIHPKLPKIDSSILNININEILNDPKKTMNIIGIIVLVLVLLFIISINIGNTETHTEVEKVAPTTTLLGNNSIGKAYKEGPYGNSSSNIKIAYILGVHPREKGAHKLMEQALKEKANTLNYTYYLYKINVTSASTDFSQSRMNGQKLAKEYVVPDIIKNNFTFAVDAHYSNGHWGVSRFIFTPSESNVVSSQLGHALAENFDWLSYYVPKDPSSPQYVTGPLNDGGVPAIIYEAYTEDNNNVTLTHDRELVDYIDDWDFTSENSEN